MKKTYNSIKWLLLIPLFCTTIIVGEEYPQEVTQKMTLDKFVYDGLQRIFFSCKETHQNNYSLAYLLAGKQLIPAAPETVTQNYIPNQPNPFYNRPIAHLDFLYQSLVVVVADTPDMHCITDFDSQDHPMALLSALQIQDAQKKDSPHPTSGIVGLAFVPTLKNGKAQNYMLLAVKGEHESWGKTGSGLALIKVDTKEKEIEDEQNTEQPKEKKVEQEIFLNILDAVDGISQGNRARPLTSDEGSCVADINDGLEAIKGEEVALIYDENFQRFFVPLYVKTKAEAQENQGACALLTGFINNDKITLYPLAPESVFKHDQDNIIGAVGPNKEISLHQVVIMHTGSTTIPYLIINGGSGTPEQSKNKVFALPLSNFSINNLQDLAYLKEKNYGTIEAKKHGVIAKKDQKPQIRFIGGNFGRFQGRCLYQAAETNQDFYQAHEPAVRVGNEFLPGPVIAINAFKDSVFALVECENKKTIFYSQALYTADGFIASWTNWKRFTWTHKDIVDFQLNPFNHQLYFLKQAHNVIYIEEKEWYDSKKGNHSIYRPLFDLVNQEFDSTKNGITGLYYFDENIFGTKTNRSLPILTITDYNRIAFVQAGIYQNNCLEPFFDSAITRALQGSCAQLTFPATPTLLFEGGALSEIAPLSSVNIAHNEYMYWPIVAGARGIAILANNNGNGIPIVQGFMDNFEQFSSDLLFHKMGDFRYVRTIKVDDNCVYVLTRTALHRFSLSMCDNYENWENTKLADAQAMGVSFTDLVVSGPCAILGTSSGLLRIGNNQDIRTITAKDISWKSVILPMQQVPIINKFFAVSSDGHEYNTGKNGQVFVLCSIISSNESFVFRLFIKDVYTFGIQDDTVSVVQEHGCPGSLTNFIAFGDFRSSFATNGLVHLSARNGVAPILHISPGFSSGKLVAEEKGHIALLPWHNNESNISIIENTTTGDWMIGGSFGIATFQ